MQLVQATWRPARVTGRQRLVRAHSRRLPFRTAVHRAARILFHFNSRWLLGRALWSKTQHVWLGKETFLTWAMGDDDLNIPDAVAGAAGAPADVDELREAVYLELQCYWSNRMKRLPRRETPQWRAAALSRGGDWSIFRQ